MNGQSEDACVIKDRMGAMGQNRKILASCKIRRGLAVAALIALACVVGVRVWWVNTNAIVIPEKDHVMGEWIAFDGAFAETVQEKTQEFSLKVNATRIMTADEYLQAYSEDGVTVSENDGDVSIVVLELEIRKDGNENGYMNALAWRLMPPEKNDAYYIDWELFPHAVPAMKESQGIFGIKPNTTRTLYIPFCRQRLQPDAYFERWDDGYMRAPITESSFKFVFTSSPVKHVVNVFAEG